MLFTVKRHASLDACICSGLQVCGSSAAGLANTNSDIDLLLLGTGGKKKVFLASSVSQRQPKVGGVGGGSRSYLWFDAFCSVLPLYRRSRLQLSGK